MDLKEILERNKKAHHRLGMITKELYDTLSDGHHTSLRMAQVNEMMNASFEMLKESDVLHSYVDEELKPADVEEKTEEKKVAKKTAAKRYGRILIPFRCANRFFPQIFTYVFTFRGNLGILLSRKE